ncbi:hypothetical protein ACS0TY_000209 [Phlomoides rotata]
MSQNPSHLLSHFRFCRCAATAAQLQIVACRCGCGICDLCESSIGNGSSASVNGVKFDPQMGFNLHIGLARSNSRRTHKPGFSLGARVIFKCLQTLAESESNAEKRVVPGAGPDQYKFASPMTVTLSYDHRVITGRFDWTWSRIKVTFI